MREKRERERERREITLNIFIEIEKKKRGKQAFKHFWMLARLHPQEFNLIGTNITTAHFPVGDQNRELRSVA